MWRVYQINGGYVVKDANGQTLAYVYGETDADPAHELTMDEARHIAREIAKLPTLLTLRHTSRFILITIAIAVVVITVSALAGHFASHYFAIRSTPPGL